MLLVAVQDTFDVTLMEYDAALSEPDNELELTDSVGVKALWVTTKLFVRLYVVFITVTVASL